MKIGEILELLHTPGKGLNAVAKEVQIGEKRLKNALNKAGYEYSQHSKSYVFNATLDYDPIDDDIEKYLEQIKSNKKVIKNITEGGQEVIEGGKVSNMNSNIKVIFSEEELQALKTFAQEMVQEQQYLNEKTLLQQRIAKIGRKERGRKTFAIAPEIEERFVKFCVENHYQQADALEIALEDLMRRYE